MTERNPYLPKGTKVGDQLVNTRGYFGYSPEVVWTVYQGASYDLCIARSEDGSRYTGEENSPYWVLLGESSTPKKGKLRYKDWIKSHE